MGAFFLIKKNAQNDVTPSALDRQMQLQGFTNPTVFSTQDYDLYVYQKIISGDVQVLSVNQDEFCVATGTLLYKGCMGQAALPQIFADFKAKSIDFTNFYGAFCILVKKAGKTYLFIDRLGVHKVYCNVRQTIISSAFLTLAHTLKSREINTQGVYEYVFQGATYGYETVLQGIKQLRSDKVYRIETNTSHTLEPIFESTQTTHFDFDELVDANIHNLRAYYQQIAKNFDSRIDTALSGGYDSRLTLALLLEQGVRPKVHVYGKSTDTDVIIASQVDQGEKIGLKHVDKSQIPKTAVADFARTVELNYYAFDGFPTDGIIGGAADLTTRQECCRDGTLLLNGGGGEIFRNFFYLPDRPYTVQQLLWTFYSQFDPKSATDKLDVPKYHFTLGEKIKLVLGKKTNQLSRTEIEMLYSIFRCRFWMGKNNSINNRLGYMLTPFIDYNIVKGAIEVPLKYKNHGLFEAKLIAIVNPKLAAYPSDYGHNFITPPSLQHKLKDWSTFIRPPRLRRYTFRIQGWRQQLNRNNYFALEYLNEIISHDYPYMKEYFKIDNVTDSAQFNRLCTLEYLFQKINAN